ncbi:hypothetical protein [Aliarcobacter cryaerophilus]|uniref:hypothetical protein n=1 Tax=Aliarcobacter cryaerophilus TaxID=28198 RepID=UPI003DA38A20
MKKIILLCLMSIHLFSNDTVYVENEKLVDGRYKDRIYTGYITVDGIPHGKGNLKCKDNSEKYEYTDVEFINGKAKSGKWKSCKPEYTKYWDAKYTREYEGVFGDFDNFDLPVPPNQSNLKLIFEKGSDIYSIEGLYEYKQDGTPGTMSHSIRERIIGKGIAKGITISCEFVIHERAKCYKGDLSFKYTDGPSFQGYLLDMDENLIEGILSWDDGTTHNYKGKWTSDQISKLKERLDKVNKTKSSNSNDNIVLDKKVHPEEKHIEKIKVTDKKIIIEEGKDSSNVKNNQTESINQKPVDMEK